MKRNREALQLKYRSMEKKLSCRPRADTPGCTRVFWVQPVGKEGAIPELVSWACAYV